MEFWQFCCRLGYTQPAFTYSKQQWKRKSNVGNPLIIKTLLSCDFIHYSGVSIFDLEQVNVNWVDHLSLAAPLLLETHTTAIFRPLLSIYDEDFCEISSWLKPVKRFRRKLSFTYLTGSSVRFYERSRTTIPSKKKNCRIVNQIRIFNAVLKTRSVSINSERKWLKNVF